MIKPIQGLLIFIMAISVRIYAQNPDEVREILDAYPAIQTLLRDAVYDTVLVDDMQGLALYRFHTPTRGGFMYIAWSRSSSPQVLQEVDGLFWNYNCYGQSGAIPEDASEIWVNQKPIVLMPCAPLSPVIASL